LGTDRGTVARCLQQPKPAIPTIGFGEEQHAYLKGRVTSAIMPALSPHP
jgi:hypothetical protein